jgi:hypothetical protein
MEKLIYLLWKKPEQTVPAWRGQLRGDLGNALLDAGALSLQCNLVDEGVATGAGLRIVTWPPPDGFVCFWMHSANLRARCEELLRETHARIAGYLVTESCIQHGAEQRAVGECSQGFSLIGFLRRPQRLSEAEWHRIWLGSHTQVAVETQASFRYVQNVVTRQLTEDAPALGALVEEGFPTAALTSPHAFYDAEGDEEKYQRHLKRMMDSVSRFIDFHELNSLPTSEYLIGGF